MKYNIVLDLDSITPSVPVQSVPTPYDDAVAKHLRQGAYYGVTHLESLRSKTFDIRLNACYYDAINTYITLQKLTGLDFSVELAAAIAVYRDEYVIGNNGKVPGYWNFTDGLVQHGNETGDQKSKNAVGLLSSSAAFAPSTTGLSSTASANYSREVAYTLLAYESADKLGFTYPTGRASALLDQANNHLDQWFTSKTATYIRPFMVALTLKALIEWQGASANVIAGVDALWSMYDSRGGSFPYTNVDTSKFIADAPGYNTGGTELAPDLNLLIAPVFAYVYKQTGHPTYKTRAQTIFIDGVNKAFQGNPKQFNQQWLWSAKLIEWLK